jgi:hypothetical protein
MAEMAEMSEMAVNGADERQWENAGMDGTQIHSAIQIHSVIQPLSHY